MTECEKYRDAISAYVDNELNNAEQEDLMRHVAQCEDCARLLDEYREVSALFHADVEAPEGLVSGVMAEIAKINRAKRITFLTRRVLPVAACLVLAVGAIRFLPRMGNSAPIYSGAAMDSAAEAPMEDGGAVFDVHVVNDSAESQSGGVKHYSADFSDEAFDVPADDACDGKAIDIPADDAAECEPEENIADAPSSDRGGAFMEINIYLGGQDDSALPDMLKDIEFEDVGNGVSRAIIDSAEAEKLIDALSFTDLACDVADIDGSGQVTVNVYR